MDALQEKLIPLLFILIPGFIFVCLFIYLEKKRKK